MHWYGGTMAEAVNLSKQRNAIFVVFVEGDNDLSKELAATIDNGLVLKKLTDPNNFLAVKLKSGSENYTYFAQIYQFVPVPSLFFIGRNGTPLEVVCAGVEPQSLATRIDRILQEHRKLVFGKEDKNPPQPSTSAQNVRDETINFIQSEASQSTSAQKVEKTGETEKLTQAEENSPLEPKVTGTKNAHADEPESSAPAAKIAKTETSNIEYEVVCDGDVCVRRPKDQAGPSSVEDKPQESVQEIESETNVEDKMERAKELIEARKKEKAAKEKEEERQKEMERRAVGQGVAELKKWQGDQELKQLQEERKREKLENNLARQRILEQIAQDRAERKAREQPATAPSPQAPSGTSHPTPPSVGDAAVRARVQFKLPDGGAHTAHFDADAPLSSLHKYLADNLQLPASNFSLWIPFPRRELTERSASLRELQLAPSAALLVLPRREIEPATPSTYGGVIAFLTQLFTSLVLDPTYHVYSWLRNRLFSNPPPSPSPNPTNPVNPANPVNPSNPSGLRRRGNIHRLNGDRSGEDDNNTWNGNSTQQM